MDSNLAPLIDRQSNGKAKKFWSAFLQLEMLRESRILVSFQFESHNFGLVLGGVGQQASPVLRSTDIFLFLTVCGFGIIASINENPGDRWR